VSAPITVSGGSASIAADCDDMVATAALVGTVAEHLAGTAARLHVYLLEALSPASIVDPDGAARYEFALARALDGPHGLSALAARGLAVQVGLRAAAEAYFAADRLRTELLPCYAAATGSEQYLVDLAVMAAGGQASLRRLAPVYPDGHAVLTPAGVDRSAVATTPPRTLRDLLSGLAHRNEGADGEIGVQILSGTGADGHPYRKVVVDIPGTKDWQAQNIHDPDVVNLGTNLRAMAGESTTYEAGVIAALKAAGVQAGDDVTIVGHSLGGTVAVNTARDLVAQGQRVSHVITAGAPASAVLADLPHSVQVLSIENHGDLVPHLDGSANPDLGNVTTVTVHHDHPSVLGNHDLDTSYVPGAADIDASDDPSVRSYLAGLHGQLNASSSTTYTYVITRGF
jgi:pimeloyl-ACP methyl ester carboxylesterase